MKVKDIFSFSIGERNGNTTVPCNKKNLLGKDKNNKNEKETNAMLDDMKNRISLFVMEILIF